MGFGQWLKQKRQALDLTQETFAEEVNCAVDTIRKIESGRRRPSRQLADLLADYLKVPLDEHTAFVQWARGLSAQGQSNELHQAEAEEADEGEEAEETVNAPWSTSSSPGHTTTMVVSPPSTPPGITEAATPSSISPLPVAPTPLVGREHEIAEASALLWRSTTRLVTLIGPPGIGKTRLALALGAALKDDFKDGLTYVPLAGVADPALVASTLAQALGVKEREGVSTPLEAIEHALLEKQMLLVLDNFEQVVEAAPILAHIMAAAPQVKFLVTSRSPLHLRGEKLMNVPPLALPDVANTPSVEELARTDAVTLFVERAQDTLGSFTLNAENAPIVAAICMELDGLPLAIELAAAKTRLLSLSALHAGLVKESGKLSLLTGGARDAPSHHQTLRRSVESSYNLLGEEEQKLFRRLGILAGPFDFEIAEEVAEATLEDLEGVLDQSLVRRQRAATGIEPAADEGVWFAMLASIREYALEQLEAAGEREALSLKHARYFLDLAERARPHMNSPEQVMWMSRILAVQADIRATLAWGLGQAPGKRTADQGSGIRDQGSVEGESEEAQRERRGIALQLASKLLRFWQRRAGISEGRRWLEEALAQSEGQPPEYRATALYVLATLLWEQTELPMAQAYLEECIELSKACGDMSQLSRAYNNLANILFIQGKYDEARPIYLDALALNRQLNMKASVGNNLANLGGLALMQGHYEEAERHELEALAIYREINSAWDILGSLSNISEIMLVGGKYIRARDYAIEGIALSKELGGEHGRGRALVALGEAMAHLGEEEQALELITEGVGIFWKVGDKHSCLESLEALAGLLARRGEAGSATRIFGALDSLREAISIPIDPNRRVSHNEGVEIVRDTLSATDFKAAWTVGQAMSLEDVVVYALQIE